MSRRLYFPLTPESIVAWRITPSWALLPLRVPTGWAVAWNGVSARVAPSGEVEFNDSEDLFLARTLPPPDTHRFSADPLSRWRDLGVDGGWYRDHFKLVVLDLDWDHPRHTFTTAEPIEFLHTLERWLAEIAAHGDLRASR